MTAEVVYIVQEFQWEYNDEWFDLEGDTPIRAFVDRDMAEAYQQRREAEARASFAQSGPRRANFPSFFGGFPRMSTLSEAAFQGRLQALGLPLPPEMPDGDDIAMDLSDDWWEAVWAAVTPDLEEAFWGLFDRLRFYEIVAVEVQG